MRVGAFTHNGILHELRQVCSQRCQGRVQVQSKIYLPNFKMLSPSACREKEGNHSPRVTLCASLCWKMLCNPADCTYTQFHFPHMNAFALKLEGCAPRDNIKHTPCNSPCSSMRSFQIMMQTAPAVSYLHGVLR